MWWVAVNRRRLSVTRQRLSVSARRRALNGRTVFHDESMSLFFLEGALATVRAPCKLEVYLGTLLVITATIKRPPRKNKNYPEASGISWQS